MVLRLKKLTQFTYSGGNNENQSRLVFKMNAFVYKTTYSENTLLSLTAK